MGDWSCLALSPKAVALTTPISVAVGTPGSFPAWFINARSTKNVYYQHVI